MNAVLFPRPSQAAPLEPYDGMPVSEADYWEHYYLGHDVTYEWNNGVLEEKGVSDHLTFRVFDWFIQLLIEFLRAQPIAERVGLEMGFRLRLPDKIAIRRPDYGLVLHDNPVPLKGLDLSYRGIFDLCLEGVSTTSRIMQERDTVVKKAEYTAGGVREYYLLHHTAELRAFYRLTGRGIYEPIPATPEGIVSSAVLLGFQWRLADLDRQPPLETLIADPVYAAAGRSGRAASRSGTRARRSGTRPRRSGTRPPAPNRSAPAPNRPSVMRHGNARVPIRNYSARSASPPACAPWVSTPTPTNSCPDLWFATLSLAPLPQEERGAGIAKPCKASTSRTAAYTA